MMHMSIAHEWSLFLMKKNKEKLIIERHRPRTIEDYVFQDINMKRKIVEYIAEKQIPHLLFTGVQGTGKTSLARLILDGIEVDEADYLKIEGSKHTSADYIRETVGNFVTTFPIGEYKVVLIEEADRLSQHAQDSLKTVFEEYSESVRFILITNREHLIVDPIKSRMQHFRFKSHKKAKVLQLVCDILDKEEADYEPENVLEYIEVCYPDIRKTLNLIQQNLINKTLLSLNDLTPEDGTDFKQLLLTIIEEGNWFDAIAKIVPIITTENWEEMYKFVYENYTKAPFTELAQMKQCIITVAEYLYRHSLCADPAINAAAMFATLSDI